MTEPEQPGPQPPARQADRAPLLGRRGFLQSLAAGAGVVGAGSVLSACGVSGQKKATPTNSAQVLTAVQRYWKGKTRHGVVNWANWPLYLDVSGKSDHPSIDQFTKATGIKVNYSEVIQDDGSFFAKVQPTLSANQYTGYDVAVITNGIYFTKMKELGFFVPLDHTRLPNFARYAASIYKHSAYDPGNVYSIPWQSGFTGIAYDISKTGRDLTSLWDLWDPAFAGKVGMFADNQDLPNPVLVAMFGDPQHTGPTQWRQAAAKLKQQRTKGIVRAYYDQSYINALSKGDIWACQAWSGDIFQALASGAKHLRFAFPKEGSVLWTDNLTILSTAQNPVDALELMDWYYRPAVAAEVAEYVNYITPVPAAQQVVRSDAAKAKGSNKTSLEQVASSPLVFPSQAVYANAHRYRTLDQTELTTWNSIFEPIYQS